MKSTSGTHTCANKQKSAKKNLKRNQIFSRETITYIMDIMGQNYYSTRTRNQFKDGRQIHKWAQWTADWDERAAYRTPWMISKKRCQATTCRCFAVTGTTGTWWPNACYTTNSKRSFHTKQLAKTTKLDELILDETFEERNPTDFLSCQIWLHTVENAVKRLLFLMLFSCLW